MLARLFVVLLFFFFFFYMMRRPPGSTLFPTRRSSDLWSGRYWLARGWERVLRRGRENPSVYNNRRFRALLWRSEEHTSELQSRFDLVCRLLLEKKKHLHHSYTFS